jgi:hypothetical protein
MNGETQSVLFKRPSLYRAVNTLHLGYKIKRLMSHAAKVAIFCEINTKYKNTLCGQNAELCFNLVLHKVTAILVLYEVNHIAEDNLVPRDNLTVIHTQSKNLHTSRRVGDLMCKNMFVISGPYAIEHYKCWTFRFWSISLHCKK